MSNRLKKLGASGYLVLYAFYVLSMTMCIALLFMESFTYLGFTSVHFQIRTDLVIWSVLVLGFAISVMPIVSLNKLKVWQLFYRKHFQINLYVFVPLLVFTLLLNLVEYLTYDNYIFSKIHFQPLLLYRVLIMAAVSMYISLSLVVRSGGGSNPILFFKLLKSRFRFTATFIQKSFLVAYSIVLLVFLFNNSSKFVYKFYQPDTSFLKENELKYYRGQMDIFEWIETFFPQTVDLVKWCNQQTSPVELITFDPQMMWMNYEGMTRVFLTNCHYSNIYSENKTYELIGKNNIYLTSVEKCDATKKDFRGNIGDNKYVYLKDVNNYYICRSQEVANGLYLYYVK